MKIQRHLGELAAAHRLMNHGGECETLHGHNWDLTVWVEAPVNEQSGIAVDFLDFDKFKVELWKELDHGVWLNERDPLVEVLTSNNVAMKLTRVGGEPTAENMAKLISERLVTAFPHVLGAGVCLGEMQGCVAEYKVIPTSPAAEA